VKRTMSDTPGSVLRVVVELTLDGAAEPLQGAARAAGSSRATPFSGALDLLRILEAEAERERRAHNRSR
jgi:hypothetical protein